MSRMILSERGENRIFDDAGDVLAEASLDISTEYLSQAIADLEAEVFSDAWSAQAVRETLDNTQALILSIWNGEELEGYVIFYYVLDEGEIARIAVAPKYRRRGVGRSLLRRLQQISEDREMSRWLLDVRRSNETAIAFYRGYGFGEDGARKNFYANPKEDAILMSREVGK